MSDEQPRTRTRLPSAREDEPPRRARHPFLTVLGVAAVVAGLLGLLLYGGRNSGSSHGPSSAAGTKSASSSDRAENAADAQAAQQAAPASAPPRQTVAGVGVGYAHTSDGAQSAAANYTVAYGSADMFRPSGRAAVISTIAAPDQRASLQTRADQAFTAQMATFGLDPDGNAPNGLTFVCRALPVGTKAVSYSDTDATIAVWSSGLVGLAGPTSTKPVTEAWTTTTMHLSWVAGDWKLVDFSTQEGPTPVSGLQAVSSADDIAQAAQDFEGLHYAR